MWVSSWFWKQSDSNFSEGQFLIPGYSVSYIIDQNCHGRGIMLFVRENISSKLLFTENAPIAGFYITKLNLGKKKWLLWGSYNTHRNTIDSLTVAWIL